MEFEADDPVMQEWRRSAKGFSWHDFDDGQGLVRAHCHYNGFYKTLGGYVADTAHVSADSIVEDGALVYGHAEVGKDVYIMEGAIIRGNAKLRGPLIIGPGVVFDGYATCQMPHQLRHPPYIGPPPLSLGVQIFPNSAISSTEDIERELSAIKRTAPKIMCTMHPVINRWQEGPHIYNMTYTDDRVVISRIPRGYERIDQYVDDLKPPIGPRGQNSRSWQPRRNTVIVMQAEMRKGFLPSVSSELENATLEDIFGKRNFRRIGRMPNTVRDASLNMNH